MDSDQTLRMDCLKLALNPLLYQSKPPTYSQFVSPTDATPRRVVDAAKTFEAYVVGAKQGPPVNDEIAALQAEITEFAKVELETLRAQLDKLKAKV